MNVTKLNQQIGNSRVTRPRGNQGRLGSSYGQVLFARPSGTNVLETDSYVKDGRFITGTKVTVIRRYYLRDPNQFLPGTSRVKRLRSLENRASDASDFSELAPDKSCVILLG